jgi:hypothetical protein
MSAMSAEAITQLSELELPAPPELFEAVQSGVSRERADDLLRDILDAIAQGQPENDLRPLQEVLESWYLAIQLSKRDPDQYREFISLARRSRPRQGLDDAELRGRLGV